MLEADRLTLLGEEYLFNPGAVVARLEAEQRRASERVNNFETVC
jgi:hypothetical protein